MIPINIKIKMPELWGEEAVFSRDQWSAINILTGKNASGKTSFAKLLSEQLSKKGFSVITSGKPLTIAALKKQPAKVLRKIEQLLNDANIPSGNILNEFLSYSDSQKRLIHSLICIFSQEHNCIILDEPESGLHPSKQNLIYSEIKKLAGNPSADSSKKIFFVITRSTNFIDTGDSHGLKNILVFDGKTPPAAINDSHINTLSSYTKSDMPINGNNINAIKHSVESEIKAIFTKYGLDVGDIKMGSNKSIGTSKDSNDQKALKYPSFKLKKGLSSNKIALTELMYSLKDRKFIANDTSAPVFKKIFSGEEITHKVTWLGTLAELKFFIDKLVRCLEGKGFQKWVTCINCFNYTGPGKYNNRTVGKADKEEITKERLITLNICCDNIPK